MSLAVLHVSVCISIVIHGHYPELQGTLVISIMLSGAISVPTNESAK